MKKKEDDQFKLMLSLKDSFEKARCIADSLTGELTEEEQKQIEAWCAESEKNQKLYENLVSEKTLYAQRKRLESFDLKSGWDGYKKKQIKRSYRTFYIQFCKYAAAIILPLSIALYILIEEQRPTQVFPLSTFNQITPGVSQAQLRLQDGQIIDLKKSEGVLLSGIEGPVVTNQDYCLSYNENQKEELVIPREEYHEIYVPKCGQYQLRLNDGTIIHLNSMSRLRYPTRFVGHTREVELEGEAYFEVAKDTIKPFIVKTESYQIEVLGTSFNVSAYEDDAMTNTTLVNGMVAISGESIKTPLLMRPNEQFRFEKTTGDTELSKVDVDYYISWKDDMFRFRDVRLEDIMRVVERWYDVKVFFESDEVKDLRFGFNVSRHAQIDSLLRIFELNGKVKIQCYGKELRITKGR